MYDELIKNLRHDSASALQNCEFDFVHAWMLEAADAIEELQKITTHYEEESKGWWLAACDAKEERERLKEQIPKWIPVTERLPEEEEVVLVWGGASVYTAKRHNKYGELMWWKLNSRWHYCNPTHWMPLPQPPEDGET